MARLRFPGRPGQRIGKNYVKYALDDLKTSAETCISAQNKVEVGLKIFHDLFGYSDEEEDFDGFTTEEIAQSEAILAFKLRQKEKLQHFLDSKNNSPPTSEIERFFSSDSESSGSSIRRSMGMRNILRKSYDKMIKDGLGRGLNKSNLRRNNLHNIKSIQSLKSQYVSKSRIPDQNYQLSVTPTQSLKSKHISKSSVPSKVFTPESHTNRISKLNPCESKSDTQKDTEMLSEHKLSEKSSAFKPFMEKVQHQGKIRRRRKRSMRPNVKKKFRGRFIYPKYSSLQNRLPTINENESLKNKLRKGISNERSHLQLDSMCHSVSVPSSSDSIVKEPVKPRSKRSFSGHKRFVLPSMSARSSRKIIPRKRYIDEYDFSNKKVLDEDSQCSRSSLSGSSETISAMDGGSSPDNSQLGDSRQLKKLQKKVGLLDRPLVVEGKRAWKPSLKVQMKLNQMNCEYPFAFKKNLDDSSGTNTSSGSFKDIIKPDMVSKYAEKMAQKPKERPFKILESFKRSVPQSVKSEPEKADAISSDNSCDGKDKVAAKIEKLLKSQWEGRLKDPVAKLPTKVVSPVEQWMSEQQERTSTQRRTKTIIRKARLQLKKRNLNLRTRKSEKDLTTKVSLEGTGNKAEQVVPEKEADSLAELSSNTPLLDIASKGPTCATPSESEIPVKCVVCGCSKVIPHPEKLYDQMSCEACIKFFSTFAETPKQYFCSKDGDCSIEGSVEPVSRKSINSRCKACWLKLCMERFTVSALLRDQLLKYVPRMDAPPHNALLIVDTTDEPIDGVVRGPRIKHVCRRAAVALGLPRATFADASVSKESFNLSALPQEEKQKILETVPVEENVMETETVTPIVESKPSTSAVVKTSKSPVKKKSRKDIKVKNRVHLDLLKKSSLLIHKEQKRRKLLMKKSMKQLKKHSFKKSLKVGKKSEMKKTLKFSYKSAVKTSLKTSPKIIPKSPLRSGKFRKVRCKQCEGCLADDCGECAYCLDKKKFGGPNVIKQACLHRRCVRPIQPASEKKSSKPGSKGKPFGSHSSFVRPSGTSLSLSSSSSSPTSPDNSSCGSSCSSTTSTGSSSSGSSGSSSSSTSSRSSSSTTTSSSSDSNALTMPRMPRTNTLNDNCANVSSMQSAMSEPVILQESECMDNNVSTNPIFHEQVFSGESYTSLQHLVSNCLGADAHQSKVLYSGDNVVCGSMYKDAEDTIFYDDSSSIIELKNASFTPSLLYGGSGDGEESVSYSTNTGSKSQGSRQNSGLRKSYCSREQDQYGSAGSGSQESNGDEDDEDDEDDHKKKKHYIYADYWEDYDFDRISSQGFALISSQQIPLPCACFLCGSVGEEKLIFCVLCCEPYHTFCLPEEDVPHEENLENWCCKRCQCCSVCGLKHNLLKCKSCQQSYHAECLTPSYPTKPSRKKKIWVCPKCVKCKSCGTTSPVCGNGLLWNFDLLLCQPCSKLTDKGNYCPVCRKCYDENDYESEMVQCFKCNRWVHASCDNITAEGYEILSCLPDTVVYTCFQCTVEETPMWKKAIKEYLKHGLKSVLNSLISARCARHLVKKDESSSELVAISNNVTSNFYQNENNKDVSTISMSDLCEEECSKEATLSSENDLETTLQATVFSLLNSVDSNPVLASNDLKNNENVEKFYDPQINSTQNTSKTSSSTEESSSDENAHNLNEVEKYPDLLMIKDLLDKGKYKTITSFFEDVVNAIESGCELGMKHHTNETKAVLIKETERIFPWFKVPAAKVWRSKIDLPEGMLPNAVLPPSIDHNYSQYLERIISYPLLNLTDPSLLMPSDVLILDEPPLLDNRTCVLCSYTGDSMPKKCGRLLYCGQDDWIHVNCALWSAEVFDQQDGSLRNVHPAIARGKLMHCEFCSLLGATVGCCVRGCPANYHFYCARKDEAVLQEDRKVFCALHKENVDARIVNENDFPIERKIFVSQASISPKWVKKRWESPIDIDTLHVVIGSLTIKKFGYLTSLSTHGKILIPIDYECTRMFWSTKNPHIRVKYTCRIILMHPDQTSQRSCKIANTTTVHTLNVTTTNDNEIKLFEEVPIKTSLADNIEKKCDQDPTKTNINETINSEVEKVLHRLVKKVAKRQKKDQLHFFNQDIFKNNNTLESTKNRNSIYNDVLPKTSSCRLNGSKKKISSAELENCLDCDNDLNPSESVNNLENESLTCDNFEGGDKSDYLDYYASLFKVSSNLGETHDEDLPFELPNQDTRRNLIKKYEFKKYRKRIKSASLTGENDIDSDTIMQLLAEKKLAKEKYESALKKYKGSKGLSPKIKSLLNNVFPSRPVTETVLPVFNVGSKETNIGITESSGYSSNEDGQLRLAPSSTRDFTNKDSSQTFENHSFLTSSILETDQPKIIDAECSQRSQIRLNGEQKHNSADTIGNSSFRNDYSEAESSTSNTFVHRKTYSKGKVVNGVCQNMIPFKCFKCKRIYRTSESFRKHSESCNFFVDSSDEEGSDSSNTSEMSSSSSKSVQILKESIPGVNACQDKIRDSINLSEPSINVSNIKLLDDNQAGPSAHNQNSLNEGASFGLHKNTNCINLENDTSLRQPESQCSFNRQPESQQTSFSSTDKLSFKEKHLPSKPQEKELNQMKPIPNKTYIQPPPPLVSPPIECNPLITQPPLQNVTLGSNGMSLITENAPQSFNCGYGTTLCNDPSGGMLSMPCNTLIIPPTQNSVQHANSVLGQIPVPQGNFLQNSIEINPGAQLSYVGSITITNNETMSLAVNVPDQIVPIYPQQDLNFGVMQNPIQMHQLTSVNVQHISVQSSFSASSLNQLVFPQQAMPYPQGQVMFMENPVAQQMPSAQVPQNYVFQMPVEQTQNCAFTAYLPQQEMQPQFVNQFAFQPQQQIQSQQVLCQQQNLVTQQVPEPQQFMGLTNQMNGSFINSSITSNNNNNNPPLQQVQVTPNPLTILPRTTHRSMPILPKPSQLTIDPVAPSPPPPDLSNRSSPASDISSNSKGCVSAIAVPPNGNIVDILKKAAERMLSMSAEKNKKSSDSADGAPEKKTRFAHTRKVAARKLERLKQRNAILNGNVAPPVTQSKPKSVQFNIAALKPAFSIPFVPVPTKVVQSSSPSPISDRVQQPSPLPERLSNSPAPLPNAHIPITDDNSDIYCYDDEPEEDSPLLRLHMKELENEDKEKPLPTDKPYLMYEINGEDGFHVQSRSLRDAWMKVYDELQDARMAAHMKPITLAPEDVNGIRMLGLDNPALLYLLEQLPGAECCIDHDFLFHPPAREVIELPENATGCARSETFSIRREYDMFNFLASEHRNRPVFLPPEEEEEGGQKSSSRRANSLDLPIAMRFRFLKTAARETVGVYRSSIHGRGLFCKRNIDPGELVIEYAGEVIRSILTDKRERIYQSKGIGCYMFRIDDDEVVDATMHGNAARFINHSCEPNCFSKVITVDGKKHIVIFALRRIIKGEELTYDYKFPFEDEKIPCHCNTRRCRKYLN